MACDSLRRLVCLLLVLFLVCGFRSLLDLLFEWWGGEPSLWNMGVCSSWHVETLVRGRE